MLWTPLVERLKTQSAGSLIARTENLVTHGEELSSSVDWTQAIDLVAAGSAFLVQPHVSGAFLNNRESHYSTIVTSAQ
ncbi:conserved protein of unknown function [Ectopseudomonas oleovorans]|uniref:Uncharacterized protein n=1 Tax=Ectopseudomonas oleovorans TaxID=301 RepID=A0A653BBV4_ECTOL|nr:conserved protein of unknown function [Pseudomonas oleovorans]